MDAMSWAPADIPPVSGVPRLIKAWAGRRLSTPNSIARTSLIGAVGRLEIHDAARKQQSARS
jgi:hypothetical protein